MLSEPFLQRSKNLGKTVLLILLASMFAAAFQINTVKAHPITIDVSPPDSPVGTTVTISGINATAFEEVRIYFAGFLFMTSATANETGGYAVAIVVPAIPFGVYPIMALDVADGDTAFAMFSVEPRITLTPTTGGYNSEVFVKGDGFDPYSDIALFFDLTDVTPFPAPQTDPLGSFEANFPVISTPNGTYVVTATDLGGNWASANFTVTPKLVFVWPSTSGSPTSLVFIGGYGFGSNVNVTAAFGSVDITPYPWLSTNWDGTFELPFFVPNVPDGTHMIVANDTVGNIAFLQYAVPSPILALTPMRTFASSLVIARGVGFMPHSAVLLYLEGVTLTQLIDLMWMSPSLMVKEDGAFEYSFVVPVTKPGVYGVVAYQMVGSPTDLEQVASAQLTIVDSSPIDVDVNVGSVHFRGETAEFYVTTALGGELVNAKIDVATLYYSNGDTTLDLTSNQETVVPGLFRIPYAIPANASQGTYTIVVEAHFYGEALEAYGTASGSFLISPTLTSANAQLIAINDQIGTVVIPDIGAIKINLTAINARLVSVQGTEATIQSDIGILKTTTDVINAQVTSVDGDMATVCSDLGTVKTHITTTGFQLDAATLIIALAAAAGSMLSFMIIRKTRTPTPSSTSAPTPPPVDPPEKVTDTPQAPVQEKSTEPEQPTTTAVMPADENESSITLESLESRETLDRSE